MAERVVTPTEADGQPQRHALPEPDVARAWLATMLFIRRFEERAGEMHAKAKIGGFLHLAIGEEGWPHGGVGATLAALVQAHGFDDLDAPVVRVTGADLPMPYSKP